jgi:molybdopterin converting factor small subunit
MIVRLPTPLIDYTAGRREVAAAGASLASVLEDLDRQYPGMRFRMIDEQGRVRAHMRFFVNGELRRDLHAALKPDDEILVVAALSGG